MSSKFCIWFGRHTLLRWWVTDCVAGGKLGENKMYRVIYLIYRLRVKLRIFRTPVELCALDKGRIGIYISSRNLIPNRRRPMLDFRYFNMKIEFLSGLFRWRECNIKPLLLFNLIATGSDIKKLVTADSFHLSSLLSTTTTTTRNANHGNQRICWATVLGLRAMG